jgi:hypothetical protein
MNLSAWVYISDEIFITKQVISLTIDVATPIYCYELILEIKIRNEPLLNECDREKHYYPLFGRLQKTDRLQIHLALVVNSENPDRRLIPAHN